MATTLTINGVEQSLTEKRISLESVTVSWSKRRSFRFVEEAPHSAASYSVEDTVTLSVDGTVHFRGRVKRVDLEGVPNAERIVYTCLGLRELSKDVTVHDPTHAFPRVVFNAPSNDDDYDSGRSGKTVGEIIKWLFDQHADDLRDAGVIAAEPATGYVQAELDDLDVAPPKVVFDSQDFDSALSELIAYQRGHRFIADPETQTFHFSKVVELPTKTITYNSSDKPLSAILKPSTEGRATAVKIYGPMRPVNATLYLSQGQLTKLWNTGLESTWTWPKCYDPNNDNTYGYVFRRFQITTASKRHIAHSLGQAEGLGPNVTALCPQVYRKTADGAWVWVPSMFDFENGVILLSQPATVGDEQTEGAAQCAADICLVYSYLGSPLSARAPASGYEGTAYTQPANPVEVVRRFYDEHFTLAEQSSQYENAATELLRAYKDIVYAGTVRLAQLDWSLADLGHRLNFTGRDDNGDPITTGFESLGAMLSDVTYDFARECTELTLTTDASEYADLPSRVGARLRELETQARRGERYRALHRCAQGPTPRAGNDGEVGAAASRGVYSIQRYGDSPSQRVAGHVDLESGAGIEITRQVDANHNGFKVSAKKPGEWYWFYQHLTSFDQSQTYDMRARGEYILIDWYPVLAGKVTKIIAYTPQQLTGGTVTVRASRKTKGEEATCPEVRTDPADPSAQITTSTNIAHDTASPGITFADEDVLGLRVITDAAYEIPPGTTLDVFAAAYFEED